MSAHVVEGKIIAQAVYDELRSEIPQLIQQTGRRPVLVSVYVGAHPAIEVYIRSQNRAARGLGIEYRWYQLPDTVEEHEVLRRLDQLNRDPEVTGVILSCLFLPIATVYLVNTINPLRTSMALILKMLAPLHWGNASGSCGAGDADVDATGIAVEGKEAVIVGHNELVGKPVSLMLLDRQATVTICHMLLLGAGSGGACASR